MRVLYVADRLSDRGGADLHLLQVIEWATEMGWRVDLAVGRVEGEGRVPGGVTVTRVRGLAAATTTGSRLESLGPLMATADIIHSQNVMNPEALRRMAETRKAIVTVQDHRFFCPGMGKTLPDGARCREALGRADCTACLEDQAYRRRIERLTSDRLDALDGAAVVVLSRYMAEELAAVGVRDAAVIPPWVEVGARRNTPGSAFVLGGRLVRHKGVLDGWRAWTEAGRPLPLRVMGDGDLAQELEGAKLLGWIDHRQGLAEISRARAVLFPSFWQEPFGMVGIESLAQGTPVIAMAGGGMEDWVGAGCLVVEPGEVRAFSEAISRLASEAEGARSLGEEGRAMVAERFCRRRLAPRLEAVYRGVTL